MCQEKLVLKILNGRKYKELRILKTIILISCGKCKQSKPSPAKDLYIGKLFRGSYNFAKSLNPDEIFIISAKYHLVHPETLIEPYDLSLNNQSTKFKKSWAIKVVEMIDDLGFDRNIDKFIILAGKEYNEYLLPNFKNHELPFKDLKGIGYQLQFLKSSGFL